MTRYVLTFFGLAFFLLVAVIATTTQQEISPDALLQRCEVSQPAWNGYQEDIKEIGAGPVAQWHGYPTDLRVSGNTVHLTFHLEAPWRDWEAALPILIENPEGHVIQTERNERQGEARVYVATLPPEDSVTSPPWLEIQYPHTRERIFLDETGAWTRSPESTVPPEDE